MALGAPLRTRQEADPAEPRAPSRRRLSLRSDVPAPTSSREPPRRSRDRGSAASLWGSRLRAEGSRRRRPGFPHAAPPARRRDSGPGLATSPRTRPGDPRPAFLRSRALDSEVEVPVVCFPFPELAWGRLGKMFLLNTQCSYRMCIYLRYAHIEKYMPSLRLVAEPRDCACLDFKCIN